MISTLVFEATYFARYSSGKKMTRGAPSASTICTALPLVTQTSDSAFTSADVLTYVTTGTPGYFSRSRRTSAPVIDSAREQPARKSGTSTVLLGLTSLAVSAMKCTPHSTMTSASVLAACIASASESPTMSATV